MVSIIVPVYNASKTLRRCVDSVLKQEYADFELFLVDDGSQDDSGTICDEYAGKDPRVRVIHKANAGVSAARNDALDQARGEYLQFLDSDDWLSPDATRLLVRTAQETQCDLVIADFYRVSGERVSHKGEIDEEGVMSRETFAAYMMENPADYYYGVLWNKLFRRKIVEEYRLRMNEDLRWCEDFLFNLEYILHAETFAALRETFAALRAPIYYYVKTKGSLVSQSMNLPNVIRMKLRVFEYYNDFYKHVLDEGDYEKNRLKVYRFLVDTAGDESLLPSLKKLGDERPTVCARAVSAQGAAAAGGRAAHRLRPGGVRPGGGSRRLPKPEAAGALSGAGGSKARSHRSGGAGAAVPLVRGGDEQPEGTGRLCRCKPGGPDSAAPEAGAPGPDPGGGERRGGGRLRKGEAAEGLPAPRCPAHSG